METFDKHGVSFVSVTQQFSTTSSMGRLTLNILLSFAQFEREIISERTRDKMAAARKKGKYIGGTPVLGYDIDREQKKLIVDETEAQRVREIFALYEQHQSLLEVVKELKARDWRTKEWVTKAGKRQGGVFFGKGSLHQLLTNVTYIGKTTYKGEVYEGEHTGIVDPQLFERVNTLMAKNAAAAGKRVPDKHGSILKGLLRCGPCDRAMSPSHTRRKDRLYRYYICGAAQKGGWSECPSRSVPADEIERFVVGEIKRLGTDPDLVTETLAEATLQHTEKLEALTTEQNGLQRDLQRWHRELQNVLKHDEQGPATTALLADLNERTRQAEQRLAEIATEEDALQQNRITEEEVQTSLAEFDALWDALSKPEQAEVLDLLIEKITYDGESGTLSITYHPTGLKAFSQHPLIERATA